METNKGHTQEFVDNIEKSIKDGSFVKLTISKPAAKKEALKNLYARLVTIRGDDQLSVTYHYDQKDEVKNFPIEEGIATISKLLGTDFLAGNLFTTEADVMLQFSKKRKSTLLHRPPTFKEKLSGEHNRQKVRLIQTKREGYLYKLGITDRQGEVLPTGQKKFRQINKYVEIISSLLNRQSFEGAIKVVDMGSGKGYLTFALYDYLNEELDLDAHITGIELRPHLVDYCNEVAAELNYDRLTFAAQNIQDFPAEEIDMLIALHACDIATDYAIAKGIKADASIIIVAPCCHQQIRSQMDCQNALSSILKHGILAERQAELITDGIRALLLEAHGYKTKVFEFISTQHTSKNLMITAVKDRVNEEALELVAAIKREFGIEVHFLEGLLGG